MGFFTFDTSLLLHYRNHPKDVRIDRIPDNQSSKALAKSGVELYSIQNETVSALGIQPGDEGCECSTSAKYGGSVLDGADLDIGAQRRQKLDGFPEMSDDKKVVVLGAGVGGLG